MRTASSSVLAALLCSPSVALRPPQLRRPFRHLHRCGMAASGAGDTTATLSAALAADASTPPLPPGTGWRELIDLAIARSRRRTNCCAISRCGYIVPLRPR